MSDTKEKHAIEFINELEQFSISETLIEDWKEDDEIDGLVDWSKELKSTIDNFLKEVEAWQKRKNMKGEMR